MNMKEYKVDPKNVDSLKEKSRLKIAPPQKIKQIINLKPEHTILDLGSGPGLFTKPLSTKANKTIAIDMERKMLKKFETKKDNKIKIIQAKAKKLPIKSNTIDIIYGITVLHEIKPEKPLKELKRTIKPNGTLLMIDFKKDPKVKTGPPLKHRLSKKQAKKYIAKKFKIQKTGEISPKTYYIKAKKPNN